MATTQLPKDFKEFLLLLNENEVEYLVIGGYAVGYHGYPRSTGDIDVWVGMNPENADRVVAALREFGFDVPNLSSELFQEEDRIVRMGNVPFRIEVVTTISGVDFEECYATREVGILDGVEANFISLHHLKVNKKASGGSTESAKLTIRPSRRKRRRLPRPPPTRKDKAP